MARLVVVSNRVGVPDRGARPADSKSRSARRSGVTAAFGSAGAAALRRTIPRSVKIVAHDNITYVTIDLRKDDYQEFYNGFANRVLWPILHYRLDLAEFTRRDLGGYFRVNRIFRQSS